MLAPRTLITEDEAAQILRPYGLRLQALRPLYRGTINSNYYIESDAGPAFLRLCEGKTDADLRFESRLIWHLTSHGLRTPELWHAHYRDPYVKIRREGALLPQAAMLFEWVQGVEYLDSEIDRERAHAVGQLLGQFHLCAATLPPEAAGLPLGTTEQGHVHREGIYGLPQIRKRLLGLQLRPAARGPLGPVVDELMAEATRLLASRPRGLPSGLGHCDLFPDNLLFPRRRRRTKAARPEDGWVLDLEQVATTSYAYDVAVALLAFCAPAPSWPPLSRAGGPGSQDGAGAATAPDPAATEPVPEPTAGSPVADGSVDTAPRLGPLRREPARALLDGYQSMRVLGDAEWQALHGELRCAAVRFTTTRLTDVFLRQQASSPSGRGAGGAQAAAHSAGRPPGPPPPAHSKDYRDFLWRLRRLKELSSDGLLAALR
jgi:Ser/Thr protein kinase RdoA (MazF antagonist)